MAAIFMADIRAGLSQGFINLSFEPAKGGPARTGFFFAHA